MIHLAGFTHSIPFRLQVYVQGKLNLWWFSGKDCVNKNISSLWEFVVHHHLLSPSQMWTTLLKTYNLQSSINWAALEIVSKKKLRFGKWAQCQSNQSWLAFTAKGYVTFIPGLQYFSGLLPAPDVQWWRFWKLRVAWVIVDLEHWSHSHSLFQTFLGASMS